ncbi:MAG: DUF975 family protein [Oscillospiraceae bacterium]|nr:DUF975 family protein [Oscillospiraceae bacterium]
MWTREQIKGNAKYVLGFSYWKAVLACLIVTLVVGISNMGSSGYSVTYRLSDGYLSWRVGAVLLVAVSILALLGTLFAIFVVNPIEVGKCRFFIANRQNRGGYDQLFSLFKSGTYLNVVKVMFLRDLYVALWSLLLLVPGIVKSYEYSMIPYILAENPQMDSSRVFEVTRSMTYGEKGSIFVLDLSFLGWIFLGAMACGVGTLFVAPYIQATYAELYEILKYQVISNKSVGMEELGGPNGYTGEAEVPYDHPYGAPGANVQRQNGTNNAPNTYPSSPAYSVPKPPETVQEPAEPQGEPSEGASWFEQQVESEKKDNQGQQE